MGSVWRAIEEGTAHPLALKLAPRGTIAAARRLSELMHPNVVRVRAVGQTDAHDYLVMDWVDGEPLGRWLRRRPRWSKALRLMLDAGAGLAAAHDVGVVHGDFKLDNVLVDTEERARVLDFGGVAAGGPQTLDYLAPEQLHGAPADARADQFAYCVAAYRALYGQRPFADRDARLFGAPRPPPDDRAPPSLFGPIRRGLGAAPERRHRSMAALIDALEAARGSDLDAPS